MLDDPDYLELGDAAARALSAIWDHNTDRGGDTYRDRASVEAIFRRFGWRAAKGVRVFDEVAARRWIVVQADGSVLVRNWWKYQSPPPKSGADRQAALRERDAAWDEAQRAAGDAPVTPRDDEVTMQRHGTRQNQNRESESDEPRFSARKRDDEERPDVLALRARGWKTVSPGQLARLDQVAERHDDPRNGVDGREWIASVVRGADGQDPLAAVFRADTAWQKERRGRAAAEEAAWSATKAAEARDAVVMLERGR